MSQPTKPEGTRQLTSDERGALDVVVSTGSFGVLLDHIEFLLGRERENILREAAHPASDSALGVAERLRQMLVDANAKSLPSWTEVAASRIEQYAQRVLKQKELDVASHIQAAAPDGCQCEPCLAAQRVAQQARKKMRDMGFQHPDDVSRMVLNLANCERDRTLAEVLDWLAEQCKGNNSAEYAAVYQKFGEYAFKGRALASREAAVPTEGTK